MFDNTYFVKIDNKNNNKKIIELKADQCNAIFSIPVGSDLSNWDVDTAGSPSKHYIPGYFASCRCKKVSLMGPKPFEVASPVCGIWPGDFETKPAKKKDFFY